MANANKLAGGIPGLESSCVPVELVRSVTSFVYVWGNAEV